MTAVWLIGAVCLLLNVRCAAHSRRPLLTMAGSALGGVGALALVGLLSPYTGVSLPLNPYTAFTGIVLGIPGITLLLFLNLLLI